MIESETLYYNELGTQYEKLLLNYDTTDYYIGKPVYEGFDGLNDYDKLIYSCEDFNIFIEDYYSFANEVRIRIEYNLETEDIIYDPQTFHPFAKEFLIPLLMMRFSSVKYYSCKMTVQGIHMYDMYEYNDEEWKEEKNKRIKEFERTNNNNKSKIDLEAYYRKAYHFREKGIVTGEIIEDGEKYILKSKHDINNMNLVKYRRIYRPLKK